jgi:hypothetical protein
VGRHRAVGYYRGADFALSSVVLTTTAEDGVLELKTWAWT